MAVFVPVMPTWWIASVLLDAVESEALLTALPVNPAGRDSTSGDQSFGVLIDGLLRGLLAAAGASAPPPGLNTTLATTSTPGRQ